MADDKKYDLVMLHMARSILKWQLISMFEDGRLSKKELMETNPLEKVIASIKTDPEEDESLYFIIDHRETILKDAKAYLKNGKHEYAKVFFAMYFEHETNHLLLMLLNRNNKSDETIKPLLRLSLDQKLTWVLDMLNIKRPSKSFLKFLSPLSEERNSFIHYKFVGKDSEFDYKLTEDNQKTLLNNIRYFRTYISHTLYNRDKVKIISRIDKLINKK